MRFNEVLGWIMDGLEIKGKAHGGSMKVMFGPLGSWRVHDDHRGSMSLKLKIIESFGHKMFISLKSKLCIWLKKTSLTKVFQFNVLIKET